MHRKFYLHATPGSSIIDEVTKVATPASIFTRDWEDPIRVIPTIQFFPETKELIEGEDAIRAYLDTIRPRPMARERNLTPIKTKEDAPAPPKKEDAQTNEEVLKTVRSQLTEELQKAKTKPARKPRKTIKVKEAT
jgi:uncharacterized protein YeaO (DUF488 family)